jgi:N-acyl-D-aspartate/D-glutamate deacylase
VGKSVARVAVERDRPAPQTALDLLREESGYLYIISFNNSEENLRKVLTHPLASVITDGMVMEGITHPRTYGTYPKFLGEYVRDKGWMTLEDAIVKTSAAAARRFGLADRGVIAAGKYADLTIFDARTIGTDADYLHPKREPQGIRHVLVNGQFAVRDGQATGCQAGAVLRH